MFIFCYPNGLSNNFITLKYRQMGNSWDSIPIDFSPVPWDYIKGAFSFDRVVSNNVWYCCASFNLKRGAEWAPHQTIV